MKVFKYAGIMFLLIIMAYQSPSSKALAVEEEFEISYTGELTRYRGEAETVIIPDNVTSIGEFAFAWNEKVTKIVIPNSVTTIMDYAFCSCTSLKDIEIPESVTELGREVFSDCISLEKIVIPSSVDRYGEGMFMGCIKLNSITFKNYNEYSIPDRMFYGCESLKSFDMCDVYRIGKESFYGCTSLTKINNYMYVNEIGDSAFENCNSLISVELPAGLVEIPDRLFFGCSKLKDIKSVERIEKVGKDAFTGTKWFSDQKAKGAYVSMNGILLDATKASGQVEFPADTKIISSYACYGNSKVTSITIPKSTKTIDSLAFAYNEKLMAVYIPSGVTKINNDVFYNCDKLTAIYGKTGSYAEEYAKKQGINFVAASSAASMKKAVTAATKEKVPEPVVREDIYIEVGTDGYFYEEEGLYDKYDKLTYESLKSSVVTVSSYGSYEVKSEGTALVLLKGTNNIKSTILKVYRVTGIKPTILPKSINKVNQVVGLADGSVVISDLVQDKDYVPVQVKLISYDAKGKERWTYEIKSAAENKNSSVIYETIFDITCDKLMTLRDGNILALGGGRGRLTGKTKSQYNIVGATWATKLEAKTGRVIWEVMIESDSSCHFFNDALEKEDGTILIYENVFSGGDDVIHLDSDGNILNKNRYSLMSENTLVTMNFIQLEDERILTVGNISNNRFKIFSINGTERDSIVATITVEKGGGGGTIGQSAPRLIKGNHDDYYVYYWGSGNQLVLIHLNSEFDVIRTHSLDISMIQNAFITPEDKLIFIGNGTGYRSGAKAVIFDCVKETTSSIIMSSYSTYYSNSPMAYGDVVDNKSIVVAGTGYDDNKTYLFKINNIDFINDNKDIQALKINSIKNQKHTGKAIKPEIIINDGKNKLVAGKDYTIAYINNTKKGTATAIICGTKKYYGVRIVNYSIV